MNNIHIMSPYTRTPGHGSSSHPPCRFEGAVFLRYLVLVLEKAVAWRERERGAGRGAVMSAPLVGGSVGGAAEGIERVLYDDY